MGETRVMKNQKIITWWRQDDDDPTKTQEEGVQRKKIGSLETWGLRQWTHKILTVSSMFCSEGLWDVCSQDSVSIWTSEVSGLWEQARAWGLPPTSVLLSPLRSSLTAPISSRWLSSAESPGWNIQPIRDSWGQYLTKTPHLRSSSDRSWSRDRLSCCWFPPVPSIRIGRR